MTLMYGGWIAALFVVTVLVLAFLGSVAALWKRAPKLIPVVLIVIAYAVTPSLLALIRGGGLDAALLGATFPLHDPFYLRGAYIAVEFLLPLVAIVALAAAAMRWRARRGLAMALGGLAVLAIVALQLGAYDAGTLGLPTLLSFEHPTDRRAPCSDNAALDTAAPGGSGASSIGSGLGALFGSAAPASEPATDELALPCRSDAPASTAGDNGGSVPAAAPAPAPAPTAAPADSPSTDMAGRLTAIRDGLPMRTLDAFTAAHSGSPADQFAFVRDKIRLDAYAGAMRGALGSANSRAGNPTDKALLLAELLKSTGATVRFARATLDASDIAQLVDAARSVTPGSATSTSYGAADIDRAVAQVSEAQRQTLRKQLLHANDIAQRLLAQADAHANDISKALADSKIVLGNDAQLRSDAAAALRDHVWVQLQNGSDWQDLDPSLPTLTPGQHLPTARAITTSDDLPDDQYAMLEVHAVGTRVAKDAVTEFEAVDATRRVVDLGEEPLTLVVSPESNPELKDLSHATAFHARLHLARDDVDGDGFSVDDPDKGTLVALTLNITVKRPGVNALTYTRSLLERRAPGGSIATEWRDPERVACSLTSRLSGLVVAGRVPVTDYWRRSLNELIALEEARAAGGKLESHDGLAGDYPYAALRFFYRAQSIPVAGARFVIDRPNIALERTSLECPDGKYSFRTTIDIMENGQAAIAPITANAARANLARGALAGVIETSLAASKPEGLDTPSILALASGAKIPTVVLRPGQLTALKALSLPLAYERAIASTLAAGQVAAATRSPVLAADASHVAWWAVDPASGNTVGRVDDGGGQGMIEYATSTVNTLVSINNLITFGFSINACIWNGAIYPLQGQSFDVGACVTRVVCKLLVDDAIDVGFSMFGLLWEEHAQTAELLDLMSNDLDLYNVVDVSGAACGN